MEAKRLSLGSRPAQPFISLPRGQIVSELITHQSATSYCGDTACSSGRRNCKSGSSSLRIYHSGT